MNSQSILCREHSFDGLASKGPLSCVGCCLTRVERAARKAIEFNLQKTGSEMLALEDQCDAAIVLLDRMKIR